MGPVLDNSVLLAFLLADEISAYAEAAVMATVDTPGCVPGLLWYELRNVLVQNERRGRMQPDQTEAALAAFASLRLITDADHDGRQVLQLARQHDLSVYDASYLELALRCGTSLATLDKQLFKAAKTLNIAFTDG